MFSKIIQQKASKLKFNVDGYLNNQRRRDPSNFAQPPTSSIPRRQNQPPFPSSSQNVPTSHQSSAIKSGQFDIKVLIVQGKNHQRPGSTMRVAKKQKQIGIYYYQETSRFKIQIKVTSENGFQLKRDNQKGLLQMHFKRAIKKKSFKQENSQQAKWMLTNQLKDDKVTLLMVNKDSVKNIHKTLFQGLISEDQLKPIQQQKLIQDKSLVIQQISIEEQPNNQDVVKFIMPTQQQLNQTEKFRKNIKDMKEEEKVYILTDIFKIKKEYEDLDRKRLKCPVYSCQKNYRQISQLKTHLKKSHLELNKHGIELTEFGTFQYSTKALDLVLYLGKVYPNEMKKIIKKMKTKPIPE